MLSELCNAARRLLDPMGAIPALISARSCFGFVTVAGSNVGLDVTVSVVVSSFDREEVVNVRITLAE